LGVGGAAGYAAGYTLGDKLETHAKKRVGRMEFKGPLRRIKEHLEKEKKEREDKELQEMELQDKEKFT